jgi:DNA polymerase
VRDVVGTISKASRAIIRAPEGKTFVLSDFSGIEARVCAWFAGEEKLLKQFREKQDVYVTMACDIFGVPDINGTDGKPIKEKRQMGKVPFLGAQYQMGWSKLIFTARNQAGVDLSEDDARNIIDVFRSKYDKIPDFWRALEDGAKACVNSGKEIVVNEFISYRMIEHNYRKWMAMRLPSGRDIYYFEPKLGRDGSRWNLSYYSPKGIKQLYGGLLTENAVQGASRDLMAEAMIRVNAAGRTIVLTVHDEIVSEIPLDKVEFEAKIIHTMMETKPLWAVTLPLSAETHVSKRFDK